MYLPRILVGNDAPNTIPNFQPIDCCRSSTIPRFSSPPRTHPIRLFQRPRGLTPTPGSPELVENHIYNRSTKFPAGQQSGLFGTAPPCSHLIRKGADFFARSIRPLFLRPFAQPINTKHSYHPPNELTASKSPRSSPNHPTTLHLPYLRLPACPGLKPLRTTFRNRSNHSQSS